MGLHGSRVRAQRRKLLLKVPIKLHCIRLYSPGEVLLRLFGGGVPLGSPNPDPISHQNM